MIFIDLSDRSGIMQIDFMRMDIDEPKDLKKAGKLRSEFVIAVTGKL